MNRNTAIVLAIVVVSGIVLGYHFIPPLLGGDEEPVSMSIEFYDKDGNLIGSSIPMAVYFGGAEVETMVIKAKWTVDVSSGIDPATFNALITIDIELEDPYNGEYQHFDTQTLDSSVIVQETYVEVHTWVLADTFPMTQEYKDYGWNLRIRSTLTPTANDFDGVAVTPDPPSQSAAIIDVALTWIDTTSTMTIISFEVNRWITQVP